MAGSNLDFWRGFFKQEGIGFDLFEVINWGITVAAADRPEELKQHRDEIMEKLFAVKKNESSENAEKKNNKVYSASFKKGIDNSIEIPDKRNQVVRIIPRPKSLIFPKEENNLVVGTEDDEKARLAVKKAADSSLLEEGEEAIKLRIETSKRKLRDGYQQAAKRQHLVKVLRMNEVPNGGICCS